MTFLGCFNLDWKGDGICDDQNNHGGCNYDGGDCCGDNVDTYLCTQCQCLEEEAPLPEGKCVHCNYRPLVCIWSIFNLNKASAEIAKLWCHSLKEM